VIDLIGHLGYIILVAGLLMVGRNLTVGWFVRFIGEMIWVVLGFAMGMTSIWAWGLVFAGIDFYTWRKWNARIQKSKRDRA